MMCNYVKKENLREIFNRIDPMGIYFEQNSDEYNREIDEFLNISPDLSDLEAIKGSLYQIFQSNFSPLNIKENPLMDKLAQEIVNGSNLEASLVKKSEG